MERVCFIIVCLQVQKSMKYKVFGFPLCESLFVTVSESELKVLLKEGPRITTLWWLAGNNGDLWQHSNVVIGRIPQDFTLLFEASTNFNKPGHVAVDDIDFTNCSFPGRPLAY